ncbi:phage holin family protein [Enterococcus hirae]|uniref:phage holin family protein n=1 Tax=Enterococcus hirae TaxID=1354 RepID=UPI001F60689C|nr:phage holin family protein [Enterococcus hirae]
MSVMEGISFAVITFKRRWTALTKVFASDQALIHSFFLVVLLDLITGWLKAKVNHVWYSTLSWRGLWKKLSHFVLLILTGVVDFVLIQNGVHFEFTLVKVFTTCLIFTEIGSILTNIAESEVTTYFEGILKSIQDKMKPKQ